MVRSDKRSGRTEDDEVAAVISGLKRKHSGAIAMLSKLEELISRRPKRVEEGDKVKAVFGAPPNGISHDTFALKYGLISRTHTMPPYDRFQLQQMGTAALKTVHCCVAKGARTAAIAYDHPEQEDESVGVHTMMLLGFRQFTKPSRQDKGKYEMRVDDDEDEEKLDQGSSSSDETLDQDGRRTHKIYVFNHAYPSTVHKHGKVLRIVVARKMVATRDALLQAACYALDSLQASSGLDKKCRPAVYLEVWDEYKWFYGILEIDAYLEVEDGEVSQDSLDYFPVEVEAAAPAGRNFTRCFTQREVRGMLKSWKAELWRQRRIRIPDGRYPVGRLFVCKKSYAMPRYTVDGSELSEGGKRFYEGNLKVLVGRRVASWTDKDVIRAWLSRQQEEEGFHKEVGAPAWIRKFLYPPRMEEYDSI